MRKNTSTHSIDKNYSKSTNAISGLILKKFLLKVSLLRVNWSSSISCTDTLLLHICTICQCLFAFLIFFLLFLALLILESVAIFHFTPVQRKERCSQSHTKKDMFLLGTGILFEMIRNRNILNSCQEINKRVRNSSKEIVIVIWNENFKFFDTLLF